LLRCIKLKKCKQLGTLTFLHTA